MHLPPLDQCEKLPDAIVLLELSVGSSLRTRITGFVVGKTWITPHDGRKPHWVHAIRIMVPEADKPAVPPYWDITGKKLCTALLPDLESGAYKTTVYTLTKITAPPVGDYTIRREPVSE